MGNDILAGDVTHTAVTAGVASGVLLAANARRSYVLIQNDSNTAIYIKLGAAAVLNQGIRLSPYASWEMHRAMGNLYHGALYVITSGAGKNVLVTEAVE